MNKQNKIIIGLLAFILTLTVGYAIFSQSLNITGTAEASADFKLIFSKTDKKPVCSGYSGACMDASDLSSISINEKTLNITVDKLNYPTAYVNIPAKVKNEGSIDAILKAIKIEGLANDDIEVKYKGLKENDVIKTKEEKDITIIVTWKEESININPEILNFTITLEYEQATNLADSGATGGSSSESDWTFKTNESGVITAYNYEKGKDVKVPAEIDGVPVTTINQNSFLNYNVVLYKDENAMKMYVVINENEPKFTIVKDKIINIMLLDSECTEGDNDCINQAKKALYICKDENTCYNVYEEENGNLIKESISDSAKEKKSGNPVPILIDTDPNVSYEESMLDPVKNITSLDLSEATNLTTIEENAFYEAGLQSVNFGENSNLQTIGNQAFIYNQISTLMLPSSVTKIGEHAFFDNPLTSILIKRTEEDFLANVTVGNQWYSGSPIITYQGK